MTTAKILVVDDEPDFELLLRLANSHLPASSEARADRRSFVTRAKGGV
jgi:hypothetical protein